jgi:hypothetical protein
LKNLNNIEEKSTEITTNKSEQRTHFKVGSRKSKLAMVQTE